MTASSSLTIIYILVVMYALCYQLQSPIQPFLIEKLTNQTAGDANVNFKQTYANIKSFFSIIQGVGSLIFGVILDRYGVRVGLIINFLACASCYYMLSITDSVEMLYASKVPGIAMAGFLCAQTAVIKLTSPGTDRLKALGRLTTSYTIGGTLGPYLGGQLGASGDYYVGAQYATIGSLLCVVLVFFLPKEMDAIETTEQDDTNTNEKDDERTRRAKNRAAKKKEPVVSGKNWLSRVQQIFSLVGIFLFIKLSTSIANSMARSSQPLILKSLGANESIMGTVMSIQFAFGGFANGFLLSPITSLMGGSVLKVVRNCILMMAIIYGFQSLLYSEYGASILPLSDSVARQYPFIVIAMILSLFQYSLGTSITTNTSNIVSKEMQGTLIGIEHSIFAFSYLIGPQVGIYVYEIGGISGLSIACASVFMLVFAIWSVSTPTVVVDPVDGKKND